MFGDLLCGLSFIFFLVLLNLFQILSQDPHRLAQLLKLSFRVWQLSLILDFSIFIRTHSVVSSIICALLMFTWYAIGLRYAFKCLKETNNYATDFSSQFGELLSGIMIASLLQFHPFSIISFSSIFFLNWFLKPCRFNSYFLSCQRHSCKLSNYHYSVHLIKHPYFPWYLRWNTPFDYPWNLVCCSVWIKVQLLFWSNEWMNEWTIKH